MEISAGGRGVMSGQRLAASLRRRRRSRRPVALNGKPVVWRFERLIDPLGGERDYENPVQAIRRGLYSPGAFCRIEYEPDPQIVDQ
jgi:hypothetical protein